MTTYIFAANIPHQGRAEVWWTSRANYAVLASERDHTGDRDTNDLDVAADLLSEDVRFHAAWDDASKFATWAADLDTLNHRFDPAIAARLQFEAFKALCDDDFINVTVETMQQVHLDDNRITWKSLDPSDYTVIVRFGNDSRTESLRTLIVDGHYGALIDIELFSAYRKYIGEILEEDVDYTDARDELLDTNEA